MLTRTWRVVSLLAAFCLVISAGVSAQSSPVKPLTKAQVLGLVRNQLGDETGARAIRERGVDFVPSEDFLEALKTAGAEDVFIDALRTAKKPEPPPSVAPAASGPPLRPASSVSTSSGESPLDYLQVFDLLLKKVPSGRATQLIATRGITFRIDEGDPILTSGVFRALGADDNILNALRSASVAPVDTAALRKHAQAAEQEYAARLQQNPQDRAARYALAGALLEEGKPNFLIAALRDGLKADPDDAESHFLLATLLANKDDNEGASAEYRKALRLRPDDVMAHYGLANTLLAANDLDGAATEFRQTLKLKPEFVDALVNFGITLYLQHDVDGAIAEYQKALHLSPKLADAHYNYGVALEAKHDLNEAISEYQQAVRLRPNYALAHFALSNALSRRGDKHAAREELAQACALKPSDAQIQEACGRIDKSARP